MSPSPTAASRCGPNSSSTSSHAPSSKLDFITVVAGVHHVVRARGRAPCRAPVLRAPSPRVALPASSVAVAVWNRMSTWYRAAGEAGEHLELPPHHAPVALQVAHVPQEDRQRIGREVDRAPASSSSSASSSASFAAARRSLIGSGSLSVIVSGRPIRLPSHARPEAAVRGKQARARGRVGRHGERAAHEVLHRVGGDRPLEGAEALGDRRRPARDAERGRRRSPGPSRSASRRGEVRLDRLVAVEAEPLVLADRLEDGGPLVVVRERERLAVELGRARQRVPLPQLVARAEERRHRTAARRLAPLRIVDPGEVRLLPGDRGVVVRGDHLGQLVAAAGHALEPGGDLGMRPRATRLRHARVGDVTDQRVAEPVLRLAGHAARRARHDEAAPLERLQGAARLRHAQRPGPEEAPHHRRLLDDALLLGRQAVEPRGEQRLDGVREEDARGGRSRHPSVLLAHDGALVDQPPQQLLDEERDCPRRAPRCRPAARRGACRRAGGRRRARGPAHRSAVGG